jgi:hypothetical protein
MAKESFGLRRLAWGRSRGQGPGLRLRGTAHSRTVRRVVMLGHNGFVAMGQRRRVQHLLLAQHPFRETHVRGVEPLDLAAKNPSGGTGPFRRPRLTLHALTTRPLEDPKRLEPTADRGQHQVSFGMRACLEKVEKLGDLWRLDGHWRQPRPWSTQPNSQPAVSAASQRLRCSGRGSAVSFCGRMRSRR